MLAAQNLIRTSKGAGGGSYVTIPSLDHISEFLRSNINLLTDSQDVTLEELIETRMLLEVPAARLAAERRREADLDRLREMIPPEPLRLDTQEQFAVNSEFHALVIEVCGNTLLQLAARPVYYALQTKLARSTLGRRFHREINAHHLRIAEAIEAGDPDAAGAEMELHLQFLVPFYERAWRDFRRARPRP